MFRIPSFSNTLPSLFLLVLLGSVYAQPAQAQIDFFKGSVAELKQQAAKQNKPYFIDFYAVWCGPCKLMKKFTFSDEEVGRYANQHFVAYALDAEKGEGPRLAQKTGIRGYPTVVFYSPEGKVLNSLQGYRGPEDFLVEMKALVEKYDYKSGGLAPETQDFLERYRKQKESAMGELQHNLFKDSEHASALQHAQTLGKEGGSRLALRLLLDTTQVPQQGQWALQAAFWASAQKLDELEEAVTPAFEAGRISAPWLHWLAWQFHQEQSLPHAPLRWINAAVRQAPGPQVLDTKAYLYHCDGKSEDAYQLARQLKRDNSAPIYSEDLYAVLRESR